MSPKQYHHTNCDESHDTWQATILGHVTDGCWYKNNTTKPSQMASVSEGWVVDQDQEKAAGCFDTFSSYHLGRRMTHVDHILHQPGFGVEQ